MCGNKIKNTCGDKVFSTCVHYEGALSSHSKLTEEDCVVVEEVIKDVYDLIDEIKESINLESVESSECLDINGGDTLAPDSLATLINKLITALEGLVCPAETPVISSDINLEALGLSLKCMFDTCKDIAPTKLSELLQILIDKSCDEYGTETLLNSGTISLKKSIVFLETTAAASFSLASAGRPAQSILIKMKVDGGNATLAVPTLNGGTTILFDNVGDFVKLESDGTEWNVITNNGCTIA